MNSREKRCWPWVRASDFADGPSESEEVFVAAALDGRATTVLDGRFTTRVSRLTVVGTVLSGQQGTLPLPGVRLDGYALGQNSGEILHNSDI